MLVDFKCTNHIYAVAQDYQHGERVARHKHTRAQLIHAISGVVTVNSVEGAWVVPPGRGVWLPPEVEHDLKIAGWVQMRTLFVDPLARADLPHTCRVVDISPLLRQLIITAMSIPDGYSAGGRDERVMELILDELRVLPVLAMHLPAPIDPALQRLCQELKKRPCLAMVSCRRRQIPGSQRKDPDAPVSKRDWTKLCSMATPFAPTLQP